MRMKVGQDSRGKDFGKSSKKRDHNGSNKSAGTKSTIKQKTNFVSITSSCMKTHKMGENSREVILY